MVFYFTTTAWCKIEVIGSGKFYKHKQMGKDGRIGRMKEEFIDQCSA